jgi:hypothetical protein
MVYLFDTGNVEGTSNRSPAVFWGRITEGRRPSDVRRRTCVDAHDFAGSSGVDSEKAKKNCRLRNGKKDGRLAKGDDGIYNYVTVRNLPPVDSALAAVRASMWPSERNVVNQQLLIWAKYL